MCSKFAMIEPAENMLSRKKMRRMFPPTALCSFMRLWIIYSMFKLFNTYLYNHHSSTTKLDLEFHHSLPAEGCASRYTWIASLSQKKSWVAVVPFMSIHFYLYHLESRWRNPNVLVYQGPLLSHLLGVAPSTFTTVYKDRSPFLLPLGAPNNRLDS